MTVTLLSAPPPMGFAIPDTHHAVSVQMTTWKDMQDLMLGAPRVRKVQRIGYPRSFLHSDVVLANKACLSLRQRANESCLLFPAAEHANQCRAYIVRTAGHDVVRIGDEVSVAAINIGMREDALTIPSKNRGSIIQLYAVFFPDSLSKNALGFWRLTGTGISSRLAETLHLGLETAQFSTPAGLTASTRSLAVSDTIPSAEKAPYIIRERICHLLKRASLTPAISERVAVSDVFLYPTGMSAIYHCNFLLQKWMPTQSIVFGFPYELTLKLLQTYGTSCRFYGFGTAEELDQLETYLAQEARQGRRVQSVWCEIASNPLLRTVDLHRIRGLADQYGFQVIVDDTIGSFANIDIMDVADIIVTSLTKSFNGEGDAMGGSLVLNPNSPYYGTMKSKLRRMYRNELHPADADILERNSRDFLPRVARMNETAAYLVKSLSAYASRPSSGLTHVYYPQTCWSLTNYQRCMRHDTPDFVPGYGGLFTLEFDNEASASTFFNHLDIHKGPSLGVVVTLAQPYVQTVFAREKEWAASYGLNETIVRISVGLEDKFSLDRAFKRALRLSEYKKLVLLESELDASCM